MNLVVDFGNSSAKAGLFDGDTFTGLYTDLTLEVVSKLIKKEHPNNILVSSVSISNEEIQKALDGKVMFLSHSTPLPFKNLYSTPETLGLDRIAAIAGAQELFPKSNCLVIDMGTCVTYDILTDKDEYQGGGISPGVSLRFRAIHEFTARLPRVEFKSGPDLIGKTTVTSIQSGVINGMIAELEGIIRRYQEKYEDLLVIMCGGDMKNFENTLKQPIFAAPELVLRGLNRILRYNA
jgi:type III pantothenate kinase